MFQQSILDSLSELGFTDYSWGDISGITPDQILEALRGHYDLNEGDLTTSMFPGIGKEMIDASSFKTYSPSIQSKGLSMLPELYKSLGGAGAIKASGGFAGSGNVGKYITGAKDVYGRSLTESISGARQSQAQGIGAISDMITQWHDMAQSIKGI